MNVSFKFKEKPNAAVSRWFSDNKLFAGVEDDIPDVRGGRKSSALPVMPKTDKEIRKEKRKAAKERQERRALKKMKKDEEQYEMEFGSEFTTVAGATDQDDEDEDAGVAADDEEDALKGGKAMSAEKKALIRSGMGAALGQTSSSSGDGKFEVVASAEEDASPSPLLPIHDDRKYDSEHEDYDEEDRAKTLALATMMIRKNNAKDMIDASYNRYAWNDSGDLPDWFVDDEEKHYRPQLPIPKKLLDQMKERFMEMATKPIKKVAEARARKNRQQMKKLKAAKKKATDIANLPDMSTREKLKAIEKAMKGAQLKKQNKV
ncbi:hypothetical protein ATCC90586_011460 [Pythium insidiosum]|nr:hypothetical protein ATCC90586_011460 [Pythium insidiosum]